MVQDMPWSWHWPKLPLWLLQNALIVWGLVYSRSNNGARLKVASLDGGAPSCEWGGQLRCDNSTQVRRAPIL